MDQKEFNVFLDALVDSGGGGVQSVVQVEDDGVKRGSHREDED